MTSEALESNPRGPGSRQPARLVSQLGYRLAPERSEVLVQVGEHPGARVLQLSPEALILVVNSATAPAVGQRVDVRFEPGSGPAGSLRAQVLQISPCVRSGSAQLTLGLLRLPTDAGREILHLAEQLRLAGGVEAGRPSPVAFREEIREPVRLKRIGRALARSHCLGTLRSRGERTASVSAVAFSADKLSIEWRLTGPRPTSPFTVEVAALDSLFRFEPDEWFLRGETLVTPLPERVERVRHRRLRRTGGVEGWQIRFQHPLWPELRIQRPLRDLSFEGLGLFTELEEDLLYPGLVIPRLEVDPPEGPTIALRGQVRRAIGRGSSPGGWGGLSVTPATDADRARWEEAVTRSIHPRTRTGGQWTPGIWELYGRSGFFRLSGKDPAQFSTLERAFDEAGRRMDSAPELGWRVAWPSSRGVEGSMSMAKAYSGSWMGHQMAKRRDLPSAMLSLQLLGDLYLHGFEPLQRESDARWIIAYCDASGRWMEGAHSEFSARHQSSGKSTIYPFRLMEVPSDLGLRFRDGPVETGPASSAELNQLLAAIERTCPLAFREALDLVPGRMDLAELKAAPSGRKLERDREVLIARGAGRPLAAAVVESGAEGINVFRLLDSVRLFPLDEPSDPKLLEEAFCSLLAAAARSFLAKGRPSFVYFHDTLVEGHVERAGLRNLGEGKLWITSTQLIPEFLEHIAELTGGIAHQAAASPRSTP